MWRGGADRIEATGALERYPRQRLGSGPEAERIKRGATGEAVAESMAVGCRRRSQVDR